MKMPILSRSERGFREHSIFAADMKAVNLDNVLVNLFMLMRNDGARIKLKLSKSANFHDICSLKERYFKALEDKGHLVGFSEHEEAVESWLRSSLVNMVFRGKAKENISSMRPLHLESYRIRNQKHARDYNAADQVFSMLSQRPEVKQALKDYMSVGWNNINKQLVDTPTLDVDTAGLLHLIKLVEIDTKPASAPLTIKPILEKQTNIFCDDVLKLLAYQHSIPRSVFIDYLRVLTGFHLALYLHKLIYLLPRMVATGAPSESSDWNLVVDVTDKLESEISDIACADMHRQQDGMLDYIRASYTIKAVKDVVDPPDKSIASILHMIKNPSPEMESDFKSQLKRIKENYRKGENESDAETYIAELDNYLQYEDTSLQKYVQCLMKVGAAYQLKYGREFLDKVSMKNSESALMIDGRSRRHPRRGALGSKLLELLVQLLVLAPKPEGGFTSNPLSIRQLITCIRERYGLIIDGSNESRFEGADVKTHMAFKANVEALKSKLRQIGFYTDLSDASSLQKIRPRYKFND